MANSRRSFTIGVEIATVNQGISNKAIENLEKVGSSGIQAALRSSGNSKLNSVTYKQSALLVQSTSSSDDSGESGMSGGAIAAIVIVVLLVVGAVVVFGVLFHYGVIVCEKEEGKCMSWRGCKTDDSDTDSVRAHASGLESKDSESKEDLESKEGPESKSHITRA